MRITIEPSLRPSWVKFKMAKLASDAVYARRYEYLHLYSTVMHTISRLENMSNPSEIDGILLRPNSVKRTLVNIAGDTQTDEIVSQLRLVV